MTYEEYLSSIKEIESLKDLDTELERLKYLVAKVEEYEARLYPLARILYGI